MSLQLIAIIKKKMKGGGRKRGEEVSIGGNEAKRKEARKLACIPSNFRVNEDQAGWLHAIFFVGDGSL